MKKEQKVVKIQDLKKLFDDCESYFVTDFKGISVNSFNDLRKKLVQDKINYVVVKNTLARIALKDKGRSDIAERLTENNAIAFIQDDPVKAARILKEYCKKEAKLQIKFGVLAQTSITDKQIVALADMPDKPALIGQLCGLLNAPLINFARLINQPLTSFACAMKQLADKQEK
ncbi:MAG: 50S ribosomal protein L10 [Candidatus Delongbacteria bacterium]|nr:50S ribosomal protein L10 [Candidatus Delongbacteria bacterium]